MDLSDSVQTSWMVIRVLVMLAEQDLYVTVST